MPANRLARSNIRSTYYPRFSEEEFSHRWERVQDFMDERSLDTLIIYGNADLKEGNQANIEYLSNYSGDFMTYFVFFADPDESPTLYGGLSNHLQYMAEVSVIDDIRLMLPNPSKQITKRIREADLLDGKTGVVSLDPRYDYSLPYYHHRTFEDELEGEFTEVTGEFTNQIHAVKSDEELEWIRKGAKFTDMGMRALVDAAEPGVTEHELIAEYKYAFLKEGGEASWNFINSAPMEGAEPGEAITWKKPSSRELQSGDIVSTEFSAAYHGYAGQLHRPIAVSQPPTDEYWNMWDIALETYEGMLDALQPGNTAKDVADAVSIIEESEYKIYDVLLHGFGNAYTHPFVGTKDSNYWPGGDDPLTEQWEFKENMTVVIQPNIVTRDETKCFQLGTTVAIAEDGPEVFHDYPAEFIQV